MISTDQQEKMLDVNLRIRVEAAMDKMEQSTKINLRITLQSQLGST